MWKSFDEIKQLVLSGKYFYQNKTQTNTRTQTVPANGGRFLSKICIIIHNRNISVNVYYNIIFRLINFKSFLLHTNTFLLYMLAIYTLTEYWQFWLCLGLVKLQTIDIYEYAIQPMCALISNLLHYAYSSLKVCSKVSK